MNKTIIIGTFKNEVISCTIKYNNERLSICGNIGLSESGQINMAFRHKKYSHNDNRLSYDELIKPNQINFASGWDKNKWYKLLEYWHLYHLNYMQAGCKHQRKLNWTVEKHLSKPCPICGYKYGHSWLFMPVPKRAITFLKSL